MQFIIANAQHAKVVKGKTEIVELSDEQAVRKAIGLMKSIFPKKEFNFTKARPRRKKYGNIINRMYREVNKIKENDLVQ
jgi:hypothetical protein